MPSKSGIVLDHVHSGHGGVILITAASYGNAIKNLSITIIARPVLRRKPPGLPPKLPRLDDAVKRFGHSLSFAQWPICPQLLHLLLALSLLSLSEISFESTLNEPAASTLA
eukprot:6271288-Heterocapsa_arctica.AAC.1